jgi:hypothetical protein
MSGRRQPGAAETSVKRSLLIYASELGARLWVNVVGHHVVAQDDCRSCQRFGRHVTVGLGNGSPDLVGWIPVTIGPEHIGKQLAVFVGIEAKREKGGTLSEDQRRYLAALDRDGAIAGVARSIADLEGILRPEVRT